MFRREVFPPLEIQRKPPRDRGSMKKGDCDTMKKFLALILTLAMALSVTACGGSDDTADDTADGEGSGTEETADYASMTDDELKAAITTVEGGKLTVATSPDFAPYEFYAIDENGDPQLAGFDMDLAQYIADYLGLSLEIVPMDFDGTIMELQNGNVDLGMAGYSPDPKRADSMDFSDIYITGGQSFVCVESNKDLFTSLEDANNADYQIGAQVGSIQADLAHENTPDADIIELAKVPDIIAELVTGKLDGAFIETMVAESYATQYPELCLVLEVPYDAEGSVVGVTKGNAALLEGVNRAIAAAKEDGSFDQYVLTANELASGDIIEGLVDENGEAVQYSSLRLRREELAAFSYILVKIEGGTARVYSRRFRKNLGVHRPFQRGPDLYRLPLPADRDFRFCPGTAPGHHAAVQCAAVALSGSDQGRPSPGTGRADGPQQI